MTTKFPRLYLALTLASALASAATAAPAANPSDATTTTAATPTLDSASLAAPENVPWQFGITIPAWLVGFDGTATVRGNQMDVNRSFNDLKDHLDQTFSLGLEARHGKWGVYGGVGYMKFSNNGPVDGPLGRANWAGELKFVIADAGVSYNLIKTEGETPFLLDGTLGLRYWYTESNLKLTSQAGLVLFDGGNTRNLEDPIIGLRGSKYLTQKLHLDFTGDIGGFGISDNQSELDWSAIGLVTYDFAKWFSLSAGYKAVGLDASRGSGAGENGVNLIFNGALIAAKFKF